MPLRQTAQPSRRSRGFHHDFNFPRAISAQPATVGIRWNVAPDTRLRRQTHLEIESRCHFSSLPSMVYPCVGSLNQPTDPGGPSSHQSICEYSSDSANHSTAFRAAQRHARPEFLLSSLLRPALSARRTWPGQDLLLPSDRY